MIGEFGKEQFVAKALGMISATQKNEEPADLRVCVDDDAIAQSKVRNDPAMELAAVAIDGRINGAKNLYVQDSALRQRIEGIFGRRVQARLKVKLQNRSRGNAKWFDARAGACGESRCSLAEGDCREHTCGTQQRYQKSMHELGPFFLRETKNAETTV